MLEETNDVKNVLCLIFNPEDGGSTFLRNVDGHYRNTRRYDPKIVLFGVFIGQLDV
jgi:hypothetical protein